MNPTNIRKLPCTSSENPSASRSQSPASEASLSSEGERIAALEQTIKAQTEAFRELNATVRDVVALKRDLDYHRRDIDLAHTGLRDMRQAHGALEDRVDKLEGKELLNNFARAAVFAAAIALIKLAWDSNIILNLERAREQPPMVATKTEEPK